MIFFLGVWPTAFTQTGDISQLFPRSESICTRVTMGHCQGLIQPPCVANSKLWRESIRIADRPRRVAIWGSSNAAGAASLGWVAATSARELFDFDGVWDWNLQGWSPQWMVLVCQDAESLWGSQLCPEGERAVWYCVHGFGWTSDLKNPVTTRAIWVGESMEMCSAQKMVKWRNSMQKGERRQQDSWDEGDCWKWVAISWPSTATVTES